MSLHWNKADQKNPGIRVYDVASCAGPIGLVYSDGMSSIYLEPVALRTVQLVNVEVLALTRARQAYLLEKLAPSSELLYQHSAMNTRVMLLCMLVYVIATPLKCSRGSELSWRRSRSIPASEVNLSLSAHDNSH